MSNEALELAASPTSTRTTDSTHAKLNKPSHLSKQHTKQRERERMSSLNSTGIYAKNLHVNRKQRQPEDDFLEQVDFRAGVGPLGHGSGRRRRHGPCPGSAVSVHLFCRRRFNPTTSSGTCQKCSPIRHTISRN